MTGRVLRSTIMTFNIVKIHEPDNEFNERNDITRNKGNT